MNDKNSIHNETQAYTRTVQEAENFSSCIDIILSNIFELKNKNIDQILSQLPDSSAHTIKKILTDNKVDSADNTAIENVLLKAKEEIKNLKIAKITLAIDPSEDTISLISDWINKNLGDGIILDLSKDESILGGVIISIDGVYKDQSLKKNLEELFIKRKSEILSSFLHK